MLGATWQRNTQPKVIGVTWLPNCHSVITTRSKRKSELCTLHFALCTMFMHFMSSELSTLHYEVTGIAWIQCCYSDILKKVGEILLMDYKYVRMAITASSGA